MAKTFTDNFIALNIAVLTVSDSRTEETDTSGQLLVAELTKQGHHLSDKQIVIDDVYKIRAQIANWIADETTQAEYKKY